MGGLVAVATLQQTHLLTRFNVSNDNRGVHDGAPHGVVSTADLVAMTGASTLSALLVGGEGIGGRVMINASTAGTNVDAVADTTTSTRDERRPSKHLATSTPTADTHPDASTIALHSHAATANTQKQKQQEREKEEREYQQLEEYQEREELKDDEPEQEPEEEQQEQMQQEQFEQEPLPWSPDAYPTQSADHAVRKLPELLRLQGGPRHSNSMATAPIPVVVWPLWEYGPDTAEALHVETNGLDESPLLVRSDDPLNLDPRVAWIGDTGYAFGWFHWCKAFRKHIVRAQKLRRARGLPTSWPVFIVDWTDYAAKQKCPQIERALGKEWVRYSKRSITRFRKFNTTGGWVHEGRPANLNPAGRAYLPTPLIVRTDTVQHLHDALGHRNLSLADPLERLDRPTDVTHLWPLDPYSAGAGVGPIQSELRTRVSRLVWDFGNRTGRSVFVGLAGQPTRRGRRGVSSAYIDALLRTKIVVVTQRDRWEDHYRLFEALVSGALVVTDRMLSLPAGLRNGTSIVEVGSPTQLEVLLEHYLRHPEERFAIAREGRRIAMARHRSWHRLEEVVFGRPLTVCPDDDPSCPYAVHANETHL